MSVNSHKMVTNLNADQLDGKDSTKLLPRGTYFKEFTRDNSAEATTSVTFVGDPGFPRRTWY